jgi:transposase
MPFDPASLPRDPDRLIEIIMALKDRNAHLQGVVATLQRALYGPRSEKLSVDAAQLPLDLDDMVFGEKPLAANDDVGQKPVRPHPPRPKATRNIGALPKHLPRYEVVIEPENKTCPCCGGSLHVIGEDVSEQLDVIPAVLEVKRIRRPRYGCRSCEGAVVRAKAPPRLVEKGMATTALVTSIVVAKFAWHLPLNRQTQMLRGHGIELDRETLVRWVLRAAWWLKPLYMLLVATVLAARNVFCDDPVELAEQSPGVVAELHRRQEPHAPGACQDRSIIRALENRRIALRRHGQALAEGIEARNTINRRNVYPCPTLTTGT